MVKELKKNRTGQQGCVCDLCQEKKSGGLFLSANGQPRQLAEFLCAQARKGVEECKASSNSLSLERRRELNGSPEICSRRESIKCLKSKDKKRVVRLIQREEKMTSRMFRERRKRKRLAEGKMHGTLSEMQLYSPFLDSSV